MPAAAPCEVSEEFLREVASRSGPSCVQISNALLHPALLPRDNGSVITTPMLESAIHREYAKQGTIYPLRHFTERL